MVENSATDQTPHTPTDKDGKPQPMTAAEIAAVCHAANLEYRLLLGEEGGPDWEHAPTWQRTSIVNGVMLILAHPETTPRESHESWYREKAEQGWKYGPVKNTDTKEHPCFLPYDKLPTVQQRKDSLFRAIVLALKG